MFDYQRVKTLTGWLVFAFATIVYLFSAETTGSLWDCGEFISGADKLMVVHPPGAPLFLLIGRLFTWIAGAIAGTSAKAFAVNILSGICTALAGMFVCWTTMIFGRLALLGRHATPDVAHTWLLAGAGAVAGLSTTFITSNWFSAVEGEVYAMSTMFTFLTLWATVKWYSLPDTPSADRWLLFAVFASGLSIGVHLLSLLTFPALALLYYFKKFDRHNLLGGIIAAAVGVAFIIGIQKIVITGIPTLWSGLELFCVNTLGLPFFASTIPLLLIICGLLFAGFRLAHIRQNALIQNIMLVFAMSVISYSTIGVVLIRAQANPPINMNNPSDPMRLLPYLNREQYGERPLLRGPQFNAQPIGSSVTERYGRVGNRYEITDHKIDYQFAPKDKVFFPRMGHYEGEKPRMYKYWLGLSDQQELEPGRPDALDNLRFFVSHQMGWMYWRYFFWNFVGRQNFVQGTSPGDPSSGHWYSGIKFIDDGRLYNSRFEPAAMKNDPGRNRYYFIPLILGILGMIFHWRRANKDFYALLAFFVITGLGIIVYSNQPPIEPRERDYVLVGSFTAFCIWIGLGTLFLFELLRNRLRSNVAVPASVALTALAPVLFLAQNFDDSSRRGHTAARDYAANFLESCAPNAILFTYGDNDTYPLWYAQEVEGIRTDVRVVNLSLIAVDWYIDQLRRKINNSPAIKIQLTSEQLRGFKRNQIPIDDRTNPDRVMTLTELLKYIGEDHPVQINPQYTLESVAPARNIVIPIDRQKMVANGVVSAQDSIVDAIYFRLNGNSLIKDDLAILDIINNNIHERPVYFAVTCRPEKLLGLDNYMQLEGMGLRVVPVRSSGDKMFSIVGSGRVNTNALYNNVMNKWKWGNLDKQKTYVSPFYQPSIQSMRFVILRGIQTLIQEGDKERATRLTQKYFEVFPDKNFRYDYNAWYFIKTLADAGLTDKVQPHLDILLKNMAEDLRFYESIGQDKVEAGFQRDYYMTLRAVEEMVNTFEKNGQTTLAERIKKEFASYRGKLPQGLMR